MQASTAVLTGIVAVTLVGSLATSRSGIETQTNPVDESRQQYTATRAFALSGAAIEVDQLVLRRDRAEMTFTGTFYLADTVNARITGAVFVGSGSVRIDGPSSAFEREHVRRLVGDDVVDSDFRTAVLRWTDDTLDQLDRRPQDRTVPEDARRLAAEFEARLTRETGMNLAARLTVSMVNGERPGLFFAQFDGGRRDRFNLLLDHQQRVPTASFGINAGEKGVVFAYMPQIFNSEIWAAFYSADDYARGTAEYADASNLVDIQHYAINIDLREPERRLHLAARITMDVTQDAVRALPMAVGEGLSAYNDQRRENQLRVIDVQMAGQPIGWSQEESEGGFTVFLPSSANTGDRLVLDVTIEGRFMQQNEAVRGAFYPMSNTSWLPRHGVLDRATFDLTYRHRARERVASIGARLSENADPDDPDHRITTYRMSNPVALAVFALGPFERHREDVVWESGDPTIPVEYNALPDRIFSVKEDFILAELGNAVRYFAAIFGRYPYETFGAAFHPYLFGQGFPSLLMLAPTDRANVGAFSFIAHETAHQWWGNIVAWRSYRDQWLSEGFAEYSGVLYTAQRDSAESADELIGRMRRSLLASPRTLQGIGSGRLNDIGPIILGLRLNSRNSVGAYQALVYNKGALVLRMLHFLLTDPATGDDSRFTRMMTDFVERHRDGSASTADFLAAANRAFGASAIALRYGIGNLNWFFDQWIQQTHLPSYRLEYELDAQADGTVVVRGTILQEDAPDSWQMVLPVVFSFDDDQVGRTTVRVRGSSSPFEARLPGRPRNVELDPDFWVLSDKTETRRR